MSLLWAPVPGTPVSGGPVIPGPPDEPVVGAMVELTKPLLDVVQPGMFPTLGRARGVTAGVILPI